MNSLLKSYPREAERAPVRQANQLLVYKTWSECSLEDYSKNELLK